MYLIPTIYPIKTTTDSGEPVPLIWWVIVTGIIFLLIAIILLALDLIRGKGPKTIGGLLMYFVAPFLIVAAGAGAITFGGSQDYRRQVTFAEKEAFKKARLPLLLKIILALGSIIIIASMGAVLFLIFDYIYKFISNT